MSATASPSSASAAASARVPLLSDGVQIQLSASPSHSFSQPHSFPHSYLQSQLQRHQSESQAQTQLHAASQPQGGSSAGAFSFVGRLVAPLAPQSSARSLSIDVMVEDGSGADASPLHAAAATGHGPAGGAVVSARGYSTGVGGSSVTSSAAIPVPPRYGARQSTARGAAPRVSAQPALSSSYGSYGSSRGLDHRILTSEESPSHRAMRRTQLQLQYNTQPAPAPYAAPPLLPEHSAARSPAHEHEQHEHEHEHQHLGEHGAHERQDHATEREAELSEWAKHGEQQLPAGTYDATASPASVGQPMEDGAGSGFQYQQQLHQQTSGVAANGRPVSIGAKPRLFYEQRRCRIYIPVILMTLVSSALITLAAILLSETDGGGASVRADAAAVVAYALLGASAALPLIFFLGCIWCSTPSRNARQQMDWYADALLEEMLTGPGVTEHYDVLSPQLAAEGTVVLLGPACSPRILNRGFAEALAEQYKTICIDLPGHGSMADVLFSLPRCERVLNAIIERELRLGLSASGGGPGGSSGGRSRHNSSHAGEAHEGSNYNGAAPNAASNGAAGPQQSRHESAPGVAGATAHIRAGRSVSNAARGDAGGADGGFGTSAHGGSKGSANSFSGAAGGGGGLPVQQRAVVLVAYGAAAYVASYYCHRNADKIAGLVLLGTVPNYFRVSNTKYSIYRLHWTCALANLALKSRIQTHRLATEAEKALLLQYDFHFGVLPDFIAEVRAFLRCCGVLFSVLRDAACVCTGSRRVFSCPRSIRFSLVCAWWVQRATSGMNHCRCQDRCWCHSYELCSGPSW